MRLLNTRTGEFKWVEDHRREHYAILSHVWARPSDSHYAPEQTYQDLLRLQKEALAGGTRPIDHADFPEKLRRFCETASKDGFEFGWADTCCIDKTSSSELSEAINSMYDWYAYSDVCYAFLRDVTSPILGDITSHGEDFRESTWQAAFMKSEWFKRGWTLQELIASRMVIFLSEGWEVLGSKHSMAACISSVTDIDITVLTFETPLEEIPIARRMLWAQSRRTTRLEDEAYCLMGIFGVNMQTNYGEGRYAFIRLQEKILSACPDQTIFAWGRFFDDTAALTPLPSCSPTVPAVGAPSDLIFDAVPPPLSPEQCLLASSSRDFDRERSRKLVCLSREEFRKRLGLSVADGLYQVFEITPYGLRGQFPLVGVSGFDKVYSDDSTMTHCAILSCEDPDRGLLALLLHPRYHNYASPGYECITGAMLHVTDYQYAFPGGLDATPLAISILRLRHYRLMYITPGQLMSLRMGAASTPSPDKLLASSGITVFKVYIPQCQSRSAFERDRDSDIHGVLCGTFERYVVEFCPLSQRVLELDGYRVSLHTSQLQDKPSLESQTLNQNLSNGRPTTTITISGKSGIDLTVQINRCSCSLGERSATFCILVSSNLDAESLSEESLPQDHTLDHTLHVHSWSFDHGSASRRVEFDIPNDSRKLCLRMTLMSFPASRQGAAPSVRRYRLGADLCEMAREPSTQSLSDSSPPQTEFADGPPSSPAFDGSPSSAQDELSSSDKEARLSSAPTLADDGTQIVGKGGSAQALIGLVALSGLLTFALLSLNRYVAR